jgi:hypothetical protein
VTDPTDVYWHDFELGELTADERFRLDQALRSEGIPASWGGTTLRVDAALEQRVSTLVAEVRAASAAVPGGAGPSAAPAWPPPMPGSTMPIYGDQVPYAPVPTGPAPAPTNTLAIVSLVLGVVGLLMCQLTGPAGLYCGLRARREIRERGGQGDGIALAGVITSAIATGLLALVLVILLVAMIVLVAAA